MTAPLYSEQLKNGRRLVNEFTNTPFTDNLQGTVKVKDTSFDY